MNLFLLRLRPQRTMPERFAWIMDALFCAIAERVPRQESWFIALAQLRIRRFGNLVNRVLAALEAGTYRAPKPRGPRKSVTPQPPADAPVPPETPPAAQADSPTPPERLPRRRGWLTRAIIGTYDGVHLQFLMNEPEFIAALQAAPALARPLRGLCHMLGIPVPKLSRLPERPRQPRLPKPPKPKREKAEKFTPYKYWMRTGPIFGERLRRFGRKKPPG
jgi:hypothetical protein